MAKANYRTEGKKMYIDSFIQKCIDGRAVVSELDDHIEYWHTHETGVTLREFLGLTHAECEQWAKENDMDFLKRIITDRVERQGGSQNHDTAIYKP